MDMQTHSSKEKNKGAVALHYAAQEDHHEVVQYLIRKSAGVNIQDARGCTPLHYAAYKGPFFLCVLPHGENGGACAMSSVPLRLASAVALKWVSRGGVCEQVHARRCDCCSRTKQTSTSRTTMAKRPHSSSTKAHCSPRNQKQKCWSC